jgi:hypothetical protein
MIPARLRRSPGLLAAGSINRESFAKRGARFGRHRPFVNENRPFALFLFKTIKNV